MKYNETDLATGRCNWLISTALQRATPEQRNVLKKNYGVVRGEAVEEVKNVFSQIDIDKAYDEVVKNVVESTQKNVARVSNQRAQKGLLGLLGQLKDKYV